MIVVSSVIIMPQRLVQVVVADFEEHQCPQDEDAQERSRDNALHEPAMQFAK